MLFHRMAAIFRRMALFLQCRRIFLLKTLLSYKSIILLTFREAAQKVKQFGKSKVPAQKERVEKIKEKLDEEKKKREAVPSDLSARLKGSLTCLLLFCILIHLTIECRCHNKARSDEESKRGNTRGPRAD